MNAKLWVAMHNAQPWSRHPTLRRFVTLYHVQVAHLQDLDVPSRILPHAVKDQSSVLCPNVQRLFGERHRDRRPPAALLYCELAQDALSAKATRHSRHSKLFGCRM